MSYEEKYKQALERMKSWANGEHPECFSEAQKAAEFIFPELAESEDEKIRKEIMQLIQCMHDADPRKERWIAWLEKQGEQPAAKIDTKFKVGDWIVNTHNRLIWQITCIRNSLYYLRDVNGNEGYETYDGLQDNYRLWTIEDAKIGDILTASDGSIFIYAGLKGALAQSYIALLADGDLNTMKCNWEDKTSVAPTTEEQRSLLFCKMKEAGYEWDAEKKELKKIEQDNHPRIVIRQDFNGGEGLYKINLDNLNEEQVDAIEMMIKNFKQCKKLDANKVIEW